MTDSVNTETAAGPLYNWIVNHDDSRMFIVAYIGLAVVLSAFVSLFWLVVVVGLHFGFELIRQKHLGSRGTDAWTAALWELRLDLALIVFAMVIALYMEYAIGVAGLRLAPRLGRTVAAGSRGVSRFAAWSRVLRAVLLSLDDAAQVFRAVILRRRKGSGASVVDVSGGSGAPCEAEVESASGTWTRGDWLIALFFAVSLALLLLAPVLTDHSVRSALGAMLSEMHPLP